MKSMCINSNVMFFGLGMKNTSVAVATLFFDMDTDFQISSFMILQHLTKY